MSKLWADLVHWFDKFNRGKVFDGIEHKLNSKYIANFENISDNFGLSSMDSSDSD